MRLPRRTLTSGQRMDLDVTFLGPIMSRDHVVMFSTPLPPPVRTGSGYFWTGVTVKRTTRFRILTGTIGTIKLSISLHPTYHLSSTADAC
jgi:hypothetical protein